MVRLLALALVLAAALGVAAAARRPHGSGHA